MLRSEQKRINGTGTDDGASPIYSKPRCSECTLKFDAFGANDCCERRGVSHDDVVCCGRLNQLAKALLTPPAAASEIGTRGGSRPSKWNGHRWISIEKRLEDHALPASGTCHPGGFAAERVERSEVRVEKIG